MPLLQIQEPKPAKSRAIGIDLGTTHSLVALHHESEIKVLLDEFNEALLPSVVRYLPEKIEVGHAAKNAFTTDPQNTFMSIKRLIGKSQSQFHTVAGKVDAVQISAEILQALLKRARQLDENIHEAVITVPAYFDDAQRQATKAAAKLAGVKVLRLLNEPTAAALAYGLDKGTQGTCLVYDLGGGTFDVSLLQLSQGVFEVLATAGDTELGGDDIDDLIVNWVLERLPTSAVNKADLRLLARKAKEDLSIYPSTVIEFQGWQGELTLTAFNQLIHPLIERTLNICQRVLKDAAIAKEAIEHVVLVGGMTRALYLRQQVEAFFGQAPLTDLDPDKVVAIGAAIQASILSGDPTFKNALLLDVIPLSLGIEMMGGMAEKILMRNTPIPAQASQSFTTYQDNQTGLSLHVLQGERELAKDCQSLAHFELSGFPAMPAGKARIEVTFRIDCDGLLNVSAIEKLSGIESTIDIKATADLNDESIHHSIEDAIENAKYDLLARKLSEKLLEAEQLHQSIEKVLIQEGHLLTKDRQALVNAKLMLSKAMQSQVLNNITQAIKQVDVLVQEFATKHLNEVLAKTLVGKAIVDVEADFS
ncbi:MAG: Fe-S protein assembly chaperone HscA [Proteobacteria bacterium]|nr:Fe-S protein assembly chaperone HscA [Pseudomonadota bacterium]